MSDFRLHRGAAFASTFLSSRQLPSAAARQMHGSGTFVMVDAIPLWEQVRDYYLAASGPEHPNTVWAMNNLAASYFDVGCRDEALTMKEKVLTLRRKLLGPEHPDMLGAMSNLANTYYQGARQDEASAFREKIVEIDPCRWDIGNDLGFVHEPLGKHDQAIAAWRKAIELNPRIRTGVPYYLGVLLQQAGKPDEALAAYRTAIRNGVMPGQALEKTLEILGQTLDQESAMAELQKLKKLLPNNAATYNSLAWPLVSVPNQEGNFPLAGEAVQWTRQACELAAGDGAILHTLGTALYRVEQWQQAIDALQGSTKNGFDVPHNWLFIAMSHWHLDAKAKEWYDKSLAWQTANEEAPKADAERQRFFAEAAQLMAPATSENEPETAQPQPKDTGADL